MDYTKDYKNKVNSLLMEKWGYGKVEEVIEGHGGKPCSEVHPNVTHLEYMNKLDEAEDLEGAEDAEQPSDKMSAGDFKTKSIEQAKMGSETGMDPKENAIISQLVDILKAAAKEGNIATGNINTLLNKVAAEAKKIS